MKHRQPQYGLESSAPVKCLLAAAGAAIGHEVGTRDENESKGHKGQKRIKIRIRESQLFPPTFGDSFQVVNVFQCFDCFLMFLLFLESRSIDGGKNSLTSGNYLEVPAIPTQEFVQLSAK